MATSANQSSSFERAGKLAPPVNALKHRNTVSLNMASTPVSSHMYRVKPIYDEIAAVELPRCMYSVASVYGESRVTNITNGEMHRDNAQDLVADLERRQEQLLERLNNLRKLVENIKGEASPERPRACGMVSAASTQGNSMPLAVQGGGSSLLDVVVSASPDSPPWSLWPLRRLLSRHGRVLFGCHTHSSVASLPLHLAAVGCENGLSSADPRTSYDVALTLVWKQVDGDCEVMVSPLLQAAIVGEVNFIRYLGRLLNPSYEALDAGSATEVDHWLSQVHHGILHGKNKEQQAVLKALNTQLGKTPYVQGSQPGLADIALWSALLRMRLSSGAPSNVKKWLKALSADPLFELPKGCGVLEGV